MNIRSAIENTIPISQFNRGLAGKIFEEVKHHGAKVVMKNNSPECVYTVISQEQVDREFGFNPADYEETDGIEFE